MTTQPIHDPRPLFALAVGQAEQQIAAVRPDELGNSTPCADYDVRALIGHMIAVLHKIAGVGAGRDVSEFPDVIDDVADTDWISAFLKARDEVDRVWADDAMLDRSVTLPWATLPGHVALDAYTHEFTVHSWDLAHATGRLSELDPDLAVQALDAFPRFAPPETRSGQSQFGPAVAVPDDADVYTRLAAYLGRDPRD
ncbi:TIGR03086 family protein [Actinomadura darangshiensis]|uniref:TIGR03086 family protein n=1 Tax=Actinomadura darangshiensis TaxID=705336 RepID=A0A4R5A741_9ACTN|nr:TIGR03086 family metal-binding protein [Actinomadura darangshiensis]TDD67445.1 TIGR03086 family protein [Actinomadura darangshiensis]